MTPKYPCSSSKKQPPRQPSRGPLLLTPMGVVFVLLLLAALVLSPRARSAGAENGSGDNLLVTPPALANVEGEKGLPTVTVASAELGREKVFVSDHYRITSDLDPDLTRDLARELEQLRAEFARRFAGVGRPIEAGGAMKVRLFRRQADYIRFTGNRFPNSSGVFMSDGDVLAVYLENQGRSGVRQMLRHEGFHQLAHRAFGPTLPVWLNEGLAQVFEEAIWVHGSTGEDLRLGEITPARWRQLKQDLAGRRIVPFDKLLRLSDEKWLAAMHHRGEAATQYTQAWAMTQFLVWAEGPDGSPMYRDRLIRMLGRIAQGADGDAAFAESFGTNLGGFQARFEDWAHGLRPTPLAEAMENQSALADLLVLLSDRGRTFADTGRFREHVVRQRYRLSYTRGDVHWQTPADPGVLFQDGEGHSLVPRQLFFAAPSSSAPLPDLVRVERNLVLRTSFYHGESGIRHEITVESTTAPQ